MKRALVGLAVLSCMASMANAAPVYWTNWTTPTYGTPGSASGTIALPGGPIAVTYTGEVIDRTADMGDWNFPATYSKPPIVDNTPTPATVSITLVGGNSIVNMIIFSAAVLDPVLAIQSLGNGGDPAQYHFSSPFTILQQGPGHWGGDATSLSQSGNILDGREGNGILQFSGVYTSISWTVPNGEDYHMFTVGVPALAIPAPGAILLGALGTGLVSWLRRRRAL